MNQRRLIGCVGLQRWAGALAVHGHRQACRREVRSSGTSVVRAVLGLSRIGYHSAPSAARRTAGSRRRLAREPGQGLTAAAISGVGRAPVRLVVLPAADFLFCAPAQDEVTVASSTKKKKDTDATLEASGQSLMPGLIPDVLPTAAPSASSAPPANSPMQELIPGFEGQATKAYTVLARRYRSRTFAEVVGQDTIGRTLQNAIATGRTAHAYLFCGTRGVGKTSMARIFARALNARGQTQATEIGEAIMRGDDMDVVEIDGASNRGIDDARDLIAGAGIAPARSAYKIYIIDEVHMLTTPAFNALLKTMEEPPPHVKFILCTTEAHKVPATIQSRCQRFDFRNISAAKIAGHLQDVLRKESIAADDAAVMQVARLANGSMRDGLSLLDRLVAASTDGRITTALLADVLGMPDDSVVAGLVAAIGAGDARVSLERAAALLEGGTSIDQALELMAERFRIVMLAAVCGADSELLEVADEARAEAARDAKAFEPATLAHLIAVCDAVLRSAKQSGAPRTLFDAAVVRMALAARFAPVAEVGAGTSARAQAPVPELPVKKPLRPM